MTEGLSLVGQDLQVPLVGGRVTRYVNLDYAASAPALRRVADAVTEFLPWYSSVHRGAGFKSQVSTRVYEDARERIHAYVGARSDDVVVITRNTTDALNLLAHALPTDTEVVTFAGEHHANLLPWRRRRVRHLDLPESADDLAPLLDEALRATTSPHVLVAVTAASNVTGELWPVEALADVAHERGARIVVDAAQLAPHGPVTVATWDVDWVALSGHKMYAPYGAGALVGRRDWLEQREPFLVGGGAVAFVSTDEVAWLDAPERQEAGSPNVVGAMALGVACEALMGHGTAAMLEHEAALAAEAAATLDGIAGVKRLRLFGDEHPRIGVQSFVAEGYHYNLVATYLSAEHGIAVRDGCFCAHPLLLRLLGVDHDEADKIRDAILAGDRTQVPGAVRISAGLGTTSDDIAAVGHALSHLMTHGPGWNYRYDPTDGHHEPEPDDRPLPPLRALEHR